MNKTNPKKRVPLGKPLRPSEADLVLTEEDKQNAAAWWRENAEKGYEGLLSAKGEEQ